MVQNMVHNLCESLVVNIGGVAGIGKKTPPTPIIFLTQWKMMGNSEVHEQEIWSCGEYSEVDGKYHILVQPQGGSIADIALDEPLRKVGDVADTIEFVNGVATVTRCVGSSINLTWNAQQIVTTNLYRYISYGLQGKIKGCNSDEIGNILAPMYITATANDVYIGRVQGIGIVPSGIVYIYDDDYNTSTDLSSFRSHMRGVELIYELATPTTETIQVPQIEEADSYTCVISQGAKAVSWSDFETE